MLSMLLSKVTYICFRCSITGCSVLNHRHFLLCWYIVFARNWIKYVMDEMCNEVLEMIAINFIWLRDTVLQHFIKHHLDWNENFQINVFE